jgi:hypothetical protein
MTRPATIVDWVEDRLSAASAGTPFAGLSGPTRVHVDRAWHAFLRASVTDAEAVHDDHELALVLLDRYLERVPHEAGLAYAFLELIEDRAPPPRCRECGHVTCPHCGHSYLAEPSR